MWVSNLGDNNRSMTADARLGILWQTVYFDRNIDRPESDTRKADRMLPSTVDKRVLLVLMLEILG